jgi:transposase InsO family protein
MKYKFIDMHRSDFEVGKMCRALRVSRSGYYAWRKKPVSGREKENEKLAAIIRDIHEWSRNTYGSPRVHAELKDRGYRIGRNRVARLMREHRIRSKVKKRFKVTTHSTHMLPVAANLLKRGDVQVHKPNQVWVSDITYIRSHEGWLYLCIIMDLYSRSIVGWSMEERLTKELVLKSLYKACMRREPGRGIIFHSDRGSQYASKDFRALIAENGFIASMSGKGNCYDNAHAESFFHTMKVEEVYGNAYKSRQEAKLSIFEYIEVFYNRFRKHSQLGYQSPYQFEQQKELHRVA